jgi:hypothetical protein
MKVRRSPDGPRVAREMCLSSFVLPGYNSKNAMYADVVRLFRSFLELDSDFFQAVYAELLC